MTKEQAVELRDKAKNGIGKEMKYKELADVLSLPIQHSNSKTKQLKDLATVCDIETLSNPTRYIIHSVYDDDEIMLVNGGKYQEPFEYAIAKLLERYDFDNVYITNTQLLIYLNLVNENYRILKSPTLRKRLAMTTHTFTKYYEVYEASATAGVILKQWVDRLLKNMEKRGLIIYRQGFCLIKQTNIDGVNHTEKVHVPFSKGVGDMENRVLKCWQEALHEYGLDNLKNGYIPHQITEKFYERFNERIRREFKEEYIGAYRCNVIVSTKKGNLEFIERYEDEMDEQVCRTLNDKAYNKIETSGDARLKDISDILKQTVLDEVIKVPMIIDYADMR